MEQRKMILAWFLAGMILLLAGCRQSAQSYSDTIGNEPTLTERWAEQSIATLFSSETEDLPVTECTEPVTTGTEATPVTETGKPETGATDAEQAESETKPESSAATEPTSTAPSATSATQPSSPPQTTESKPTEPAQTEPAPTQPKPTESTPTEPKPTEPAPPPHTHSWGAWQQTKAPTCTEPGEERRTCPGCGAVESRPITATGNHTWSETAPTCTQDGVKSCQVCGVTETTAALGHDWIHHDEEGEYRPVITCYCGERFIGNAGDDSAAYAAWHAHAHLSYDIDYLSAHSGFEEHEEWFITQSAYDECSRCGAVK